MNGRFTIIRANGRIEVSGKTAPVLEDMQAAVGGNIETVPDFYKFNGEDCVAFCNEEGKIEKLPVNHLATTLWDNQCHTDDYLSGDVLIVTGDEEFMEAV